MENQKPKKDGSSGLLTPAEQKLFTPDRLKRMIYLMNFKPGN